MLMSYLMCYNGGMENKPAFEEIKTFDEFSKYYWYRDELLAICRRLGICASGYKAEFFVSVSVSEIFFLLRRESKTLSSMQI